MGELYVRIDALCQKAGTNITAMCKDSGISRAPLTELKMGRTKNLSSSTLAKIADYFNVTVDYLLTGEEIEKAPAQGEGDVLDEVDVAFYGGYKELNESDKEVLRDMVRVMRERRKQQEGE